MRSERAAFIKDKYVEGKFIKGNRNEPVNPWNLHPLQEIEWLVLQLDLKSPSE